MGVTLKKFRAAPRKLGLTLRKFRVTLKHFGETPRGPPSQVPSQVPGERSAERRPIPLSFHLRSAARDGLPGSSPSLMAPARFGERFAHTMKRSVAPPSERRRL